MNKRQFKKFLNNYTYRSMTREKAKKHKKIFGSDMDHGIITRDYVIISRMMKSWYSMNEPFDKTIRKLRMIEDHLRREYDLIFDNDDRSGEETYGYESEESIQANLNYISDRWYSKFRIRWMIDLIEKFGV